MTLATEKISDILEKIADYEHVALAHEPETGLKAIIVLHDTSLGPALGGTRMYPYHSFNEALHDALRLAKGMTYKAAAADLDFGGGKAVILGDPLKHKSPELFRAYGRFVDRLGGAFFTGTDMGTIPEDFVHAAKETPYIVGLPEAYGGSGDSSEPTALGVLYGIRATLEILEYPTLSGTRMLLQGVGKVGRRLAEKLLHEDVNLFISDTNMDAVQDLMQFAEKNGFSHLVQFVSPEKLFDVPADVFLPCAIGGTLNEHTIKRLQVKGVVGSANNQLLTHDDGERLRKRGILYAPDFIVNAGGLIQVADELYGFQKERVLAKTRAIYDSVLEIFKRSEQDRISTLDAAEHFVQERLRRRRKLNRRFKQHQPPKWNLKRGE